MKGSIVALPGFLGVPADWTAIFPHAHVPEIPILPFWDAAEWLNAWAMALPAPRTLAGYSLGGRLALHALIRSPQIWSRAAILSAHPGISDPALREKRLTEDLLWAGKFRCDPWETLIPEWNRRGALSSSGGLARSEENYSRELLSKALEVWSLGCQEDLAPLVQGLDIPFHWFVGELDSPFREIGRSLKFKHPRSRVVVVPGSGHRILHDNPQDFLKGWP